jgi:hypothetical protein
MLGNYPLEVPTAYSDNPIPGTEGLRGVVRSSIVSGTAGFVAKDHPMILPRPISSSMSEVIPVL